MTVWFTSDPHFMHEKIAQLRGFESARDHDERIKANWRAQIKPGDQVWLLGDLTTSKVTESLSIIHEMPGEWHLVAGNHDPVHSMHRHAYKQQQRFLYAFASVQDFARRRVAGHDVLLSHFPYETDHTTVARYTQYRLRDEGRWLLHGHTHGKERLHGHEIHVGLDAWDLKLVSLDTIATIIQEESRGESHTSASRT